MRYTQRLPGGGVDRHLMRSAARCASSPEWLRQAARMTSMEPDLAQELGTRETAALEFKSAVTDRDKLRKTICALANDLPNVGGGDLWLA